MKKLSEIVVFLDVDGVLVDFVGGALEVFGWSQEEYEMVHEPGRWSMIETLGLTVDEFWYAIGLKKELFWEELSPLPWANGLLEAVERGAKDYRLVSMPSRNSTSWSGKVRLIKAVFGRRLDKLILTLDKTVLAKEGTLLIDDREKNVLDFIAAGGDALLFPSYHNRLWEFRDEPLKALGLLEYDVY